MENTEKKLVFRFVMDGFSSKAENNSVGTFTSIRFNGQNSDVLLNNLNLVPAQSVVFGVPEKGSASVVITPESIQRISLKNPLFPIDKNEMPVQEALPVFSSLWLSEPLYGFYAGLRTGQIFIRPFIIEPNSGMLAILSSAVVTVNFPAIDKAGTFSVSAEKNFHKVLKPIILNYSIASKWVVKKTRAAAKSRALRSFSDASNMYMFTVGDGSSGYNEGQTEENQVVRISAGSIPSLIGQPISDISIYASIKAKISRAVPGVNSIPEGVLEIPLLRVDVNANNRFDNEDYLLAYSTGTNDWVFNNTKGIFEYVVNPFDDYRHYWVALNSAHGRTMQAFSQPPAASSSVTSFEEHLLYRRALTLSNRENSTSEQSGTSWYWLNFNSLATRFDLKLALAGLVPGSLGKVNLEAHYKSNASKGVMTILLGETTLCAQCDTGNWYDIPQWTSDSLKLRFTDAAGDKKPFFELTDIQIRYARKLDMTGINRLTVFSSNTAGITEYTVTGLPNEKCRIVRIPQDEGSVSLVSEIPSGTSSFSWNDSGALGVRYFIFSESGIKTPALSDWYRRASGSYEMRQPRTSSVSCDYLIITDSVFSGEAARLARHKKTAGRFLNPLVVRTDDIYRQFSGGNTDPGAIRNFLQFAANNWQNGGPSYVLLFGNGHYDYKAYATNDKIHVPVAEIDENCVENFYACIDSGEDIKTAQTPLSDFFIGRFPCNTINDASAMVDKVVEMEGETADYGAWRNRVLLVADDDMQGISRDPISALTPHHGSSEDVEDVIARQRETVEIRKVYLFDYEWNEAYLKPEASRALMNEVNQGVGFVNYFGHGSDDRWADEGLLTREQVSGFSNKGRYPVMLSFSCSVGRFDRPSNESLSDMFVNAKASGASISISSTRKAYASYNELLAESFFNMLYSASDVKTVGQAYFYARALNSNKYVLNYALFGDPSLQIANYQDSVSLSLFNKDGKEIDTLRALQQGVKVRGTVLRNNVRVSDFGTSSSPAYVQVALYNPGQDSAMRKDGGSPMEYYRLPGKPVFVGTTTIINGSFEQSFFLPRNLFFDKPGVRLTAYAWQGKTASAGIKKDVIFHGTDVSLQADTIGPDIAVKPVYSNKKWNSGASSTDRITAVLPLECNISLFDESGIDVVGTGPDEGLTVEAANLLKRQNINHKFLYDEGDVRSGSATITFEEGSLKEGENVISISSQDLLGNVSNTDVTIDIVPYTEFKLGRVFNYPNPMRMGQTTRFYFQHSNNRADDPALYWYGTVRASIRIYTLSGKLLRVIKNAENGQSWDGTDEYGNKLAPNVYLYRISAVSETYDGDKSQKSDIKKLVIRPPNR